MESVHVEPAVWAMTWLRWRQHRLQNLTAHHQSSSVSWFARWSSRFVRCVDTYIITRKKRHSCFKTFLVTVNCQKHFLNVNSLSNYGCVLDAIETAVLESVRHLFKVLVTSGFATRRSTIVVLIFIFTIEVCWALATKYGFSGVISWWLSSTSLSFYYQYFSTLWLLSQKYSHRSRPISCSVCTGLCILYYVTCKKRKYPNYLTLLRIKCALVL